MRAVLAIAVLLAPFELGAQARETWVLGTGFRMFGERLERPGASFRYANSVELELRAEKPVSRRFALTLAGAIAPGSAQREEAGGEVALGRSVIAFGGEAGLSFRFKPAAPIYFTGAAVFTHFTRYADPSASKGGTSEPGAAIAMGFDKGTFGRYNLRFQLGMRLMKPYRDGSRLTDDADNPEVPSPNKAKSITGDWGFLVAIRQSAPK